MKSSNIKIDKQYNMWIDEKGKHFTTNGLKCVLGFSDEDIMVLKIKYGTKAIQSIEDFKNGRRVSLY